MIANREDLYGRGFQKFREFERKFGIKQLLEWVKTIR
jgi:hypothetical protein